MGPRNTVFISHARPDDDDLTRWLCGRLTARGYRVWADLEQLVGGEPAWSDIENAIRQDSARFICLVTNVASTRTGVKNEIAEACAVAQKLGDKNFIIPIKADDLPWSDFPIQLKQINGIDFSDDWPSGFSKLLKALERDGVLRGEGDAEIGRVCSLLVSSKEQIKQEKELALRNWLSIDKLPDTIHYYHTSLSATELGQWRSQIAIPHAVHDRLIITFGSTDAVRAAVPPEVELEHRYSLGLGEFLEGAPARAPETGKQQARNYLSDVLRRAFEAYLREKGLMQFDNRWFVPNNWRKDNEGHYIKPDGKAGYRVLVGKAKELTWHFAISTRVFSGSPRGILVIPHVLFSSDGVSPLADQKQLRRRYCKLWWNDRWRDLLQALLSELLGNGAEQVSVSAGGGAELLLTRALQRVDLEVSYSDATAQLRDEEDVDHIRDEDLEDEE